LVGWFWGEACWLDSPVAVWLTWWLAGYLAGQLAGWMRGWLTGWLDILSLLFTMFSPTLNATT